MVGVPVGSVCR